MQRNRLASGGAVTLFILLILAVFAFRFWPTTSEREEKPNIEERLVYLRNAVQEQEKESAAADSSYNPQILSRLDDLSQPVELLLRQLPGVVNVEVAVRVEKPTHRIVHLRDLHDVPKELYAIDLQNALNRKLAPEEIDLRYEALCLEVETVELEQVALLRCLVKHHGLKAVFSEGLTPDHLVGYRDKIAALQSMEKEEVPQLRQQLDETRHLKKSLAAKGQEKSERYQKASAIETEIAGLIWEQQKRMLEVGAPGRLLVQGDIEEVLPLDDALLLVQANPITPDGKTLINAEKIALRRDGMVKAATGPGEFALIVLGASHDLSESVRREHGERCEYLRVTTKRVKEFLHE